MIGNCYHPGNVALVLFSLSTISTGSYFYGQVQVCIIFTEVLINYIMFV